MNRLLLIAALALALPRASHALTLEQALSAPWTSQLVAARKAPRIAWVTEARGVSNVYVADAPRYQPRQLTRYTADDGLTVQQLAISDDGKTVVFARHAGGPNAQGELGNPTADVGGHPGHEVVAIDVATAAARRLSDSLVESAIALSPDGRWAAWTGKDLTIVALAGKAKPRTVGPVHGAILWARWSPDGKALAYTVQRGGHAVIALYRPGDDHVRYLAPSLDIDILPRWSPDGASIAFARVLNDTRDAPMIPRSALAFSLWVADVATGRAHRVFDAGAAPEDSFLDETSDKSLFYAKDHLVFAWEHDGRNHLYSVPAQATDAAPRLLTPGDHDTDDVALSPDGTTLAYSSNQGDVDRRHIWRVPVDGSAAPAAVTRGETIEWSPVFAADGGLLCLSSTATTPGAPAELKDGARHVLTGATKDFPASELVTPTPVIVKAADGTLAHGQLFTPPGGAARRPALVFLHGGPVRQMMLGFHDMRYYHFTYAMNQFLAAHGYVVMSLNYRGGIMYGRAFREPRNDGWRGNVEIAEIRAAGKYLAALPGVDPRRVGIFGGSNGGYLTVMALAKDPQLWAAGVDLMGVHDWWPLLEADYRDRTPADREAAKKLARDNSPVGQLATLKGPLLVVASDDDRNVPVSQAEDFIVRLRKAKIPFEQLMIPDEQHDPTRWQSWVEIERATVEFFDRKLTGAR